MKENCNESTLNGAPSSLQMCPVFSIPSLNVVTKGKNAANQKRINNFYWISEYADDIFQTLREAELKRHTVYFRSTQCSHRPNLLRLLNTAMEKYKLSRTTYHLAVYLLDCFMDNYTVRVDKLNLTALTCLILAAKIEETDLDTPKFFELNKLVGNVYTVFEYRNVEFKILSTFHFDLIRPTSATFAEYFANSFITLNDFHLYLRNWHSDALSYQSYLNLDNVANILPPLYANYEEMVSSLSQLLFKLTDLSLNYMKFANARPSIIAAACIAAVRRLSHICPIWTPYLIKITDCTLDVIDPFVEAILTLYKIHINKKRARQASMFSTPGHTTGSNVLCDSPDSGIVSANDTKSDLSENDDDDNGEHDDEAEEEVDEGYTCLEYPGLAKRRRLI